MLLTVGYWRALLATGPVLGAVSLVSSTFNDQDENGVVISRVVGWKTGSSLSFIPNSGGDSGKLTIINDEEANFPICVGAVASTVGTIAGVIRETNPLSPNSPYDTPITLTCKAFDYFVDPVSGSPANDGLTKLTAFQALANLPATQNIHVGLSPVINRETFNCLTAGVYIRPWNTGTRAANWGSVSHTSGWTQVGVTFEWKKTIGYVALNVFEISSVAVGATVTKFIKGTVTALTAGQFGTNATEVFIYSLVDPNGRFFEIPKNDPSGTAVGLSGQAARVRWAQMDTWFCPADGLEVSAADVTHYGMDSSYNANDGSGGSTGAMEYWEYWVTFKRNGQARSTGGAAGDGGSRHVNSTGGRYVVTVVDNEKEGIGDQRRASIKNSRIYFENNNNEYIILDEGTGPGGHHRLTNSIIVWPLTNTGAAGAVSICQSNAGPPPPTVEILNVAIIWKGGASKVAIRQNNGNSTIKNVIIYGSWLRGIDFRGATDGGTMVNTNLCVNGATTAYFNNGTPGVVAGPNSILTDPLFVNPGAGDYRLQAASPCFATGIAVGLKLDYIGTAWLSPPNMGAYQTAV